MYVFQYLQMSDLWFSSYTVHRTLPIHYAASEHMIQYNYLCCFKGDGPYKSDTVEYTDICCCIITNVILVIVHCVRYT